MTQCFFLLAEVRMNIKDAQAEHPFEQDELQQLKVLMVGEGATPEAEEDKSKPSSGKILFRLRFYESSSGKRNRREEIRKPPLTRPAEDMGTQEIFRLAR